MRACQPIQDGYVERDGVKIYYEVFGDGEPTVLLLPTWSLFHSRMWKMHVPYLSRHCRVITFDGRGNGRSDRPTAPEAYAEREFAADALAVMDATQTARAIIVGFSMGGQRELLLAANHPSGSRRLSSLARATRAADSLCQNAWFTTGMPSSTPRRAGRSSTSTTGCATIPAFWTSSCRECLPSRTPPNRYGVGWGLETTGETLALTYFAPVLGPAEQRELARRVRCPVLVVHGEQDAIGAVSRGIALAEHTGAQLILLEGSSHAPHLRDPVKVNLLLRDFVKPPPPPQRWVRGRSRRKRALYISSPIGLGHAQRDVAIADELRKLHPDLEIDWLAQHPVTAVLQARDEHIHPASRFLASESSHIESESAEHDLHCFQAIRRMDEILLSNFMVFHDAVREEAYDLWIGDEAWELDYYLHENPEQKRAAYVWLTDFVGWLPMPDGGEREAFLTADYNAEMIEHIARFPRVRDRAIFVGNDSDIVPDAFGPELPLIRDWTREHYSFAGYVTGFDPSDFADRRRLRHELGYRDDEQVCIVTVGGSGVGGHLLRRIIEAFPEAKRRVPALRMVVVTGPRIDPQMFGEHEGLEVRGFIPQLYRHLAVCDLAVVQGGLTTCMELAAAQRPFLYFPLRHHFEQNFHVRHRLNRYGAGRMMDFALATPETIAEAIAEEIAREVDYRPVERDGAARAAALIAQLL
jgi:pimeloyl-ACP methyl ester carboxylesterase/predicted glycosyltransferase